jgi:predicted helicase
VIKQIHKKFDGQQGLWSNYVENHLLPRLNGFELLMASYAMAHLQLDLLLTETGYKPTRDQRLKVFLTNSLEEAHPATGTLFANWLSTEANEANKIKRDTPVMCVIGNPPYSVSSSNKSKWIEKLMADYKSDLNERNIQPLSDDYIKFIRFGQHFIHKNGSGILAYISNNSFLDGLIHRQMRKHLLESFDKIYILDLHGSAKKNEVAPDGTKDENVFDIQQGVSINIFVKTAKKRKDELGQILHCDLFGKRERKYTFLSETSLKSLAWSKLESDKPNYFFVNKTFDDIDIYENGFKVEELFIQSNAGLATEWDELSIKNTRRDAELLLKNLQDCSATVILSKYSLNPKKITKVENAIKDIKNNKPIITTIDYRPFDFKHTVYTGVSNGLMGRPRDGIMRHMLRKNLALLTCRQQTSFDFQHIFISDKISERCSVSLQTGEVNYIFPIYLYPDPFGQQSTEQTNPRIPNLNPAIVNQISAGLGLTFTNEKETTQNTFAPIDLLDYIYAVLHSPTYREKYKEFLKIDFPRVPYPKAPSPSERAGGEAFWQLVKLGGELRQIHLLESSVVEKFITQYPVDGSNVVGKVRYEAGNVYINDTQYFANVPDIAWNFYIGGYQPAQKWLKDRKGRKLEFEDILHYQKMIVALTETNRLMKEIDKVEIE